MLHAVRRGFRILDVSRPLSERTAVWPGDAPFRLEWVERIGPDSGVNLSVLHGSPHAGTHTDAPLHLSEGSPAVDDLDLASFLGPARVAEVRTGEDGLIRPEVFAGIDLADPPRLLLKSGTHPDTERWPAAFAALAPETAALFVQGGVVLVGLDTPGVDPEDSRDLPAHRILLEGGVRWLENLDLSGAAAGVYWLAAQPIRIRGADAAPVRAVLLDFCP